MENVNNIVEIKENTTLLLTNPTSYNFIVNEGVKLELRLAIFDVKNNIHIKGFVKDNGHVNIAIADFSNSTFKATIDIDLNGDYSQSNVNLASLSKNDNNKEFSVSIKQTGFNTHADIDCYGVATNNSSLIFSGTSHILNGSRQSFTSQKAKIIVFDENVKAKASPILKIDENDVKASHSALVGKLNPNHLYYLQSRGIKLDDAKKLITYGYLKPIEKYFNEDIASTIENIIKEGVL